MYVCECCPKEPKEFDNEEDLRYAISFTHDVLSKLTD
jgi:hypothetical protein